MLRAFVRLTTGLELGLAALTVFIGGSLMALVNVGTEGAIRAPILAFIALTTLVLLGWIFFTVGRRYRRLQDGRCGHPACRGTVESRDGLPEHLVECSKCRRVWPKLVEEPQEVPAT